MILVSELKLRDVSEDRLFYYAVLISAQTEFLVDGFIVLYC